MKVVEVILATLMQIQMVDLEAVVIVVVVVVVVAYGPKVCSFP
jgi:hypothetical protein